MNWVGDIQERGIEFRSIHESINTSTSTGKLIFHIFAALAEFERNLISERTLAGLQAARARGRRGRPNKLGVDKQSLTVDLYKSQNYSVNQICEIAGISKPTLYSYLHKYNQS